MRGRGRSLSRYPLSWLRRKLLLIGAKVFASNGHFKCQNLVISGGIEGSVGDRALLESLLDGLDGDTRFVTADRADYELNLYHFSFMGISLPKIFGFRPISNIKDCFKLGMMMGGADKIFIIGADIADGKYSESFSHALWDSAIVGKILKKTVTMASFSWNTGVSHSVRKKAAMAQERGVLCRLRDPISYKRFCAYSSKGAVLTADLVFSKDYDQQPSEESKKIDIFLATAGKSALVNISGFIANSEKWLVAMQSAITYLTSEHYKVIILPMVFRIGQSDLDAQNLLRKKLIDKNLYFVETELSPAEVLQIIDKVEIVISGRMHLGILALKKSKPALVISTQGKVQGLMTSINREQWVLENPEDVISRTLKTLEELRDKQNLVNNLEKSIKLLEARSLSNFDGLLASPE